MKKMGMEVV